MKTPIYDHPISKKYRYGFNGMEVDNEFKGNGNSYTTEFRQYDPRLGRWLSIDPLFSNFPWQSPYVAFDNNPIRYIDNDGRESQDIIILLQKPKGGHSYGHQAILVGDDEIGWTYISLDGDNDDNSDNYTIQKFESLKKFRNSEHNSFKNDYDDGANLETSEFIYDENFNKVIVQRYTDAYRIKTTKEQDKIMIKKATATAKKGYRTFSNNCTYIPRDALRSVKLNDGEDNIEGNNGERSRMGNYYPRAKQKAIEDLNKGTDIDNEIKRD